MEEKTPEAEPVEEPTEPVEVEEPKEEPKFNKTQLQQISSITGNLLKRYIEDEVMPAVERARSVPVLDTKDTSNPAVEKFNNDLQEMILSGNVTGAIDKYLTVKEQAAQNLSQQQKTALNKDLSAFEEKPYYKEVFSDMQKKAQELVSNGYPPGPAANTAYHEAVAKHLMGQSGEHENLTMTSGGRRRERAKPTKLPPAFQKAYERDKSKGLFSNEKEYIDNLSPNVRSQYGI